MANHTQYLPFCFAYKHITPNRAYVPAGPLYQNTPLPSPPSVVEALTSYPWSPIYEWTPGSLRPIPVDDWCFIEHHAISSVYWCSDLQTYMSVGFDCTAESVTEKVRNDPLDDWDRLGFEHATFQHRNAFRGRCVSVVGHRYPERKLGALGPATWVPELIPMAHQPFRQPHEVVPFPGTSFLAGDLSILLGLVALSTTPDTVEETIIQSFRPATSPYEWVPHRRTNDARTHDRGIVVEIKHDTRSTTADALRAWEAGTSQRGPILM